MNFSACLSFWQNASVLGLKIFCLMGAAITCCGVDGLGWPDLTTLLRGYEPTLYKSEKSLGDVFNFAAHFNNSLKLVFVSNGQ